MPAEWAALIGRTRGRAIVADEEERAALYAQVAHPEAVGEALQPSGLMVFSKYPGPPTPTLPAAAS